MRTRRRTNPFRGSNNFWQSYSDMMAALLLVFALVLTGTILQSQKEFEKKEAELSSAASIIADQQGKLERLLGIREEIIEALRQQFSDGELDVDAQTGAIVFNSNLLFAKDDSVLSDEGKAMLTDFLPQYFDILLSPAFKEYVAEITIEGHTDSDGLYMYNLNLSQDRALSVATFFLSETQTVFTTARRDELRALVTANGRSWSDPIKDKDGNENKDASRRVEIQFRLKDQEMIEEMLEAVS